MKKHAKKIIIAILVLAAAVGVWMKFFMPFGAPEDIQRSIITDPSSEFSVLETITPEYAPTNVQTVEFSNFVFEGFTAMQSSHAGTFEKFTLADVNMESTQIKGGKITFDTTSIKTDDPGLDEHLCANDMIDCVKYPTTTFTLLEVENNKATGWLEFFGTKKQITFDMTKNESGDYAADFVFDTNAFGFQYDNVDTNVRISFTATLN